MHSPLVNPHHLLSLLILLTLLTSPLFVISATTCDPVDEKALRAIAAHFNNIPFFSSWSPSVPCCTAGQWKGVDCTEGRVTGFHIENEHNISGTIPPSLADLPFLHTLIFEHLPNLVGPIPAQIAEIKKLSFLSFTSTGISGQVPSFLSQLPALSQLDLSFNKLSGPIPGSLVGLNNLFLIDFRGNQLTGTVPPSLFSKSPDPFLRLGNNKLSGEVPEYLGDLNLIEIDLSGNRFTGDASFLFGRLKLAQKIILAGNELEFDLSKVEFPERILLELDLSRNKIYGRIPKETVRLKNLYSLNLSYNRLCGRIPTGGRMGLFNESSYVRNECLCGNPLPPCK